MIDNLKNAKKELANMYELISVQNSTNNRRGHKNYIKVEYVPKTKPQTQAPYGAQWIKIPYTEPDEAEVILKELKLKLTESSMKTIKVGDKVHVRPEMGKTTDTGVITKVLKTDRFGDTTFYFKKKNGDEWMSGTDQIRKLNGKAVNESIIKQLVESGAGVKEILTETKNMEITLNNGKSVMISNPKDIKDFKAGKDVFALDSDGEEYEINKRQAKGISEAIDSQEQIVDDFEDAVNRIEKSKKIFKSKGVTKDYLNWVLGMGPKRAKSMLNKGDSAIAASMKKFED